MAEHGSTPDVHLHRAILSKHQRGPWSSGEDQYLLELVRTQGASNWVRISQLITSRSPKQCRERYHQNLKPSLNFEPITPEEGVMIERMVCEMGKRWAEIARRLHGRSDNAVKNWWNGGMNRRKRLDNRRAEMVPRHAQRPYHIQPQHQSSMQPQSTGEVYDSYDQRPQQQTHKSYYASRAASQAPAPRYVSASSHRYVEAPLPSPSAFSTNSRAESAEGNAPSLISDMSYAGSYSHPATPPQAAALPSMSLVNGHYQQQSEGSPNNSRRSPTSCPIHTFYASKAYDTEPRPCPLLTEHWRVEQRPQSVSPLTKVESLPQQYSMAHQQQLPSFHTISLPQVIRGASPNSIAKDKRMDLSKLLA